MPIEALNTVDELDKVVFFGAKLKENLRRQLTAADMSMSTEQVSQLTLSFMDPGFEHLKTGVYQPGIPVKFEDLMLEVGSVDTTEQAGNEKVEVRCRSRIVRKLKKRRGRKVLKQASPSEFIRQECKAIGAKHVVQDTPQRKQVARDVPGKRFGGSNGTERPSSWTTFQRLAAEEGMVLFEIGGTLYFGKPTWLLDRAKENDRVVKVNWRKGDEDLWPESVPECSVSADGKTIATVTVTLPRRRARECRPGKVLRLRGVPNFEDHYLIQQVDYSLLGDGPVTVVAGTPIDPEGTRYKGRGGHGGIGSNSIRDLLRHVGFRGEALEMAIAIVMAESGGDPNAKGDVSLEDAKWGPSIGLFQIRSLKHPSQYGDPDNKRIASKLDDPIYNARLAYKISNGGKDWSDWSTYNSGAYRKYYRTGTNYKVKGWTVPKSLRPHGDGVARRGTKSALDFVQFALNQAGDRYIYGAETSPGDRDPSAWDCSELVQWACAQVGVYIPDGSSAQAAYVRNISVSEAIRTRGALLFKPGHVAISLGNGYTIEALNPGYGVASMSATNRSFSWTSAGLVPGMRY